MNENMIEFLKEKKKQIKFIGLSVVGLVSLPVLGTYIGYKNSQRIQVKNKKREIASGLALGILISNIIGYGILEYKERCLKNIKINKNITIEHYMKEIPKTQETLDGRIRETILVLSTNKPIYDALISKYNNKFSELNVKARDGDQEFKCVYESNNHLKRNFDLTELNSSKVYVQGTEITGTKTKQIFSEICLGELEKTLQ